MGRREIEIHPNEIKKESGVDVRLGHGQITLKTD